MQHLLVDCHECLEDFEEQWCGPVLFKRRTLHAMRRMDWMRPRVKPGKAVSQSSPVATHQPEPWSIAWLTTE